MPLLTKIDRIPLFSTLVEAERWATANGLEGTHTHMFNGVVGYMGGSSHSVFTSQDIVAQPATQPTAPPPLPTPPPVAPTPPPTPPPPPTITITPPSTGGGGGGY